MDTPLESPAHGKSNERVKFMRMPLKVMPSAIDAWGKFKGCCRLKWWKLLKLVEPPDCAMVLDAVELPEEIARHQRKIDELSVAKTVLESRAQTQYELDQSAYDLRMAERAAQTVRIGRKIPSRVLQPPFYPSRTPPNTTSPIRTPES